MARSPVPPPTMEARLDSRRILHTFSHIPLEKIPASYSGRREASTGTGLSGSCSSNHIPNIIPDIARRFTSTHGRRRSTPPQRQEK